jgi:hypothetical protein
MDSQTLPPQTAIDHGTGESKEQEDDQDGNAITQPCPLWDIVRHRIGLYTDSHVNDFNLNVGFGNRHFLTHSYHRGHDRGIGRGKGGGRSNIHEHRGDGG